MSVRLHIKPFHTNDKSRSEFAKQYLGQIQNNSASELKALFRKVLENGIHGLCFSIYEDGQKPGDIILAEQVQRRLNILKPHINWVRSFSCIEGNEWIPKLAKKMGIKTLVGAWLGSDEKLNEKEINSLINLAKQGHVDIAAVGNEVLYRKDLNEQQLLNYINRVKQALPNIPVGYVDAYYEFTVRPEITKACDVILTNCYPFWESTPFENALPHMQQMYAQAKQAGQGKPVIITETGWPSKGQALGAAKPSTLNALKYFLYTQLWANAQNIETFYFASFDEAWKVGSEGDVGAYWGLWDKNGDLKY